MTEKTEIQAKIKELREEDKALRDKKLSIMAKYQRPAQWIRDNQFVEIAHRRIKIEDELAQLYKALEIIENQEWVERQKED